MLVPARLSPLDLRAPCITRALCDARGLSWDGQYRACVCVCVTHLFMSDFICILYLLLDYSLVPVPGIYSIQNCQHVAL